MKSDDQIHVLRHQSAEVARMGRMGKKITISKVAIVV